MPTATYTGEGNFSPEIKTGPAQAMIFPGNRPVPVTDEVAQILVRGHAKNFTVVDDAGELVKPTPEPEPTAKKAEESAASGKGKPGK